jgi:protoporphyrinogen oxidase
VAAPRDRQSRGLSAMRIGVIGGGLMGLAVADRLSVLGHATTVFERAPQVGGLATWQDFGAFVWDRFYHVILPSDAPLIGFLRTIGVESELRWGPTKTGYFVDNKFFGLSNNAEFLKFPPLNLWHKFRLALTILYCSRINDWRKLETVSVEDWLVRHCGRAVFEKFWKPLLLAKLGENYKRVSAVFIWSYIKRLFSARDSKANAEHMGYVRGGYRTVFKRLEERLRAAGGDLKLGVDVKSVRPAAGGGVEVTTGSGVERFDKVVFTGPVSVMRAVVDPALVSVPAGGKDVEYLGVVCPVVLTRKPLQPYYVLNIADEKSPFTGVIGMTTLIDTAETAGLHMNYLPKYVLSDDPFLQKSDAEIRAEFMRGLEAMFPNLAEAEVVDLQVYRAIKVQPLQVLNYSQLVQQPKTLHPDFYVLNSAQFVNNTLNNNQVIKTVNEFFAVYEPQFGVAEPARAAA